MTSQPSTDRILTGLRRLALASLALAAVMLPWCASAIAGTYTINNCASAAVPNSDPGPWVIFGGQQPAKAACSNGLGDYIGPRGAGMSPNTTDGVELIVPAGSGITIREAKLWWGVPHQGSGADTFALVATNAGGIGEANTPYDRKSSPDVEVLPSTTSTLMLVDYCSNDDAGAGCSFSSLAPNLELYGAQTTLAESGPPTGSASGGGLASAGPISGVQSLGYNAQDGASGVRLAQLRVDGEVVATKDYVAQCAYSNFAACPASESDTISWNTATVADGSHTVQLEVKDAAQNSAYLYTGSITTSNAPVNSSAPAILAPSGVAVGASLSAQPGGWTAPTGAGAITYAYQWQDCDGEGNNCHAIAGAQSASYSPAPADVGHALRVVVSAADNDGMRSATSPATAAVLSNSGSLGAPNGPGGSSPGSPGSPSAGSTTNLPGGLGGTGAPVLGVGAANGTVASEATVLHLGLPHAISRAYARRAFALPGRLTNNQEAPIAGASLDILETVAGTSRVRLRGHVVTSAAGTFTAKIPAGPSRQIEVAYRAFSGDSSYAAVAKIIENVGAGARLHIAHSHVSSTGTIKLSGTVAGPLPRRGAIVELLVHYRGRWQPIRTPRTNSRGSFKIVYQFQGARGRFPFRVEIPAGQASYPYGSGFSNTVNVTTH
jgi:hypothetical protein